MEFRFAEPDPLGPSIDGAVDILGLDAADFSAAAERLVPETAGLAPRVYKRVFTDGILDAASEGASPRNAAAWTERFRVGLLPVLDRRDDEGEIGKTTKLVFGTRDGHRIESVSIPMYGGKRTICISSQIGCARSCAFCETGRRGLVRNLDTAEIVSQVLTASFALGVRFRNIVFMGMGEPTDNLENVGRAIRVFAERRGLAYSMERMTVCTSGDAEGIRKLSALGLKRLNLSVSLNAGRDELRDRLMPVNLRTPLSELAAALAVYPKRRNFVLGVNYCLLPDINDSPDDAEAVARFCSSVGRSLVNLIPYNPGTEPIARAPSDDEIERFISQLQARGVPVRLRREKGRGVMAACGQLGGT